MAKSSGLELSTGNIKGKGKGGKGGETPPAVHSDRQKREKKAEGLVPLNVERTTKSKRTAEQKR